MGYRSLPAAAAPRPLPASAARPQGACAVVARGELKKKVLCTCPAVPPTALQHYSCLSELASANEPVDSTRKVHAAKPRPHEHCNARVPRAYTRAMLAPSAARPAVQSFALHRYSEARGAAFNAHHKQAHRRCAIFSAPRW